MADTYSYIASNKDRYEEELKEFLRIPSVSADSRQKPAIEKACQFVADQLQAAGLATEIILTRGNPLVYAECSSPANRHSSSTGITMSSLPNLSNSGRPVL